MKEQNGYHGIAIYTTEFRSLSFSQLNKPQEEQDIKGYNYETSEETPFLPNGAKDEICALFRYEVEFGLCALQEALSKSATAADRTNVAAVVAI